jgi:2'-5' RNA ligase
MAEPDKPKRRRVFFGLVPNEETRALLIGATRRAVGAAGGRATAPDNLHLTLAFLGGVTEAQLDKARAVPPLAAAPFTLTLDRLGFWSRSQILWIGPTEPTEPLLALERALWGGLAEKRFQRERGRFRPHVTLARGARAARAPIRPVRWRIERLTLLESVQDPGGVRYVTLRDWPLAS